MTITFEIAVHQGCRLTETQLPLTSVDLRANTIRFTGKGRNGVPKVFTTALHPGLRPLMLQLVDAGAVVTCTHPKMSSVHWFKFLNEIGLGHLCFHCTRVTVITRLARAGVPIQQAMRFVGHSSEQVHAIYQKLKSDDLSACTSALASLTAPPSPS
jgi:integrase